jgi:hypothetical protein
MGWIGSVPAVSRAWSAATAFAAAAWSRGSQDSAQGRRPGPACRSAAGTALASVVKKPEMSPAVAAARVAWLAIWLGLSVTWTTWAGGRPSRPPNSP